MKTILLTGGSGFFGKNFFLNLNKDYKVLNPTSKTLNLCDEISVFNFFNQFRINFVIHCATHNATITSDKDKNLVLKNNLKIFFNLEKYKNYYDKMIYFGSGAGYGKRIPNVDENFFENFIPNDDYGLSKFLISKYIDFSSNIYELICFGVYGPYEDYKIRFISNAILKTIFDYPIDIKQNVFFDYIYINDLTNIVKYFLECNPKHKKYNIGVGKKIDLFSLAKIILSVKNKNNPIIIRDKGLNDEYTCNNQRLIKEIGLYDFYSHKDAISELYLWYEKNISIIDKRNLYIDYR